MSTSTMPAEAPRRNPGEGIAPPDNYNYYRDCVYWNSFERVIALWNELISGDRTVGWVQYFKQKYGTFATALSLNCGNGWVERALFEAGVIESVIGVDIGKAALEIAAHDAKDITMPSKYIEMDINELSAEDIK